MLGFNDTGWPIRVGLLSRLALWFQSHSITYLLLREKMSSLAFQAEVRVFEEIHTHETASRRTKKELRACRRALPENTFCLLFTLLNARGISVILVKQPITAHEAQLRVAHLRARIPIRQG